MESTGKLHELKPQYVEFVPDPLERGILYVSLPYRVAIHLCACGCGVQTVTPLDPKTGWSLKAVGNEISLYPSIGNQQICGSHYWIKDSKIEWLPN